MLMNMVEAYMNDEDHPERGNLMIFLDMEKAFDRVSYDFLLQAAEAVGFGPRFLRTIRMMYSDTSPPKRRIYANGHYSEWFPIQSGVAQGCPLSPLLFLLVAQALYVAVEQSDFQGTKIGGRQIKISQFADDASLFPAGPSQLPHMEELLAKWGRATGMRENMKKRQGLATGKYRRRARRKKLPKSVDWIPEGSWAIVLGAPVGNDMDHDRWWKKKIIATQGKAQRFIALFRASYFGRNLIVQTKYFGALRYWLYSMPMGRTIRLQVKDDADTLWWSRTPDLFAPRTRIRRFVARNTAIGPTELGGLNTMDWDSHVTAVMAEWILRFIRPPDEGVAMWKHVMHTMVLVDKRGHDKFPEGKAIFLCDLSIANKLRLMRGIPRKATYVKECIRAFFKLKIKPNPTVTTHMRAEPFWHNPRFTIQATVKERNAFSTIVDVHILGDIMDSSTNELRTKRNWKEWIVRKYTELDKDAPNANFARREASRMWELASQVPTAIIETIQQQANEVYHPKKGAIVMIIAPDLQDQGEGTYAKFDGTRYLELWLDAYGVPHETGTIVDPGPRRVVEVEVWNTKGTTRIVGPAEAVTRVRGWTMDGEEVTLDTLRVSTITRALALRKFVAPVSEEAWKERGVDVPWYATYKLGSFYATPRDRVQWIKLWHRTLYTVGHRTDMDNKCRACSEKENQLHLCTCDILRLEFWDPVIALLEAMEMPTPANITDFIVGGRMRAANPEGGGDEGINIDDSHAGMMFLAWRCLYAEITNSREEKETLNLQRAYDRLISMTVSRLTAYGEKWLQWVAIGRNKRKTNLIPEKHRCKGIINATMWGEYTIHPALTREHQLLEARKREAAKARPPQKTHPQNAPHTKTSPRADVTPQAPTRRKKAVQGPNTGTTATTQARTTAHTVRRRETPQETITPPPPPEELDEWRDLAGDAITTAQGMARGSHPQCTLASVRNLRRNQAYSTQRLAENCLHKDSAEDIRCPNWPQLMIPLLQEGEVIQSASTTTLDHNELCDFRVAVMFYTSLATQSAHVVCIHRGPEGNFRLYDNDSAERRQGRFKLASAQELIGTYTGGLAATVGILRSDSRLSSRLGPPLTTWAKPPRKRPRPAPIPDPDATRPVTKQRGICSYFSQS